MRSSILRWTVSVAFFACFACTALAQNNSESPLVDAPPTPSAGEQAEVVEKARNVALQYTDNLPNFICTETIQRYMQPKLSNVWKLQDTLILDLAFSEKGERYKLLTINNKATNKSLNKVGGAISTGEFGTILQWLFRAKSETKFKWERWTNLRSRRVHVISYRIEQNHSEYQLNFRTTFKTHHSVFAFSGLVFVDGETFQVLRITHAPERIPTDWPVTATSGELDYGFAEIGAEKTLVPLHAEMIVVARAGGRQRNAIEFNNYRKFSSEATLKFEEP